MGIRAETAAGTGRDVQGGYLGEWPEPSAGESEAQPVHNAVAVESWCCGLCEVIVVIYRDFGYV